MGDAAGDRAGPWPVSSAGAVGANEGDAEEQEPEGQQGAQNGSMTANPDRWHRWLLDVRHGGDAAYREKDLAEEGLLDRCRFVLAPADRLAGVTDASVDVVTTRSVLIYVKDKAGALREFYRVLKPGGRVSLFEPINVLMSQCDPELFYGYDVAPVSALALKVQALYESIQPPGTDPIGDFDERDLVRHAQAAGFPEINLELRVSVKAQKESVPWQRFMRTSGNPLIPTFGEALEQVLSPVEARELTAHLRPLVESGAGLDRMALAYLTAVKR